MAYQTLEYDRRGGLAARERREELSDPVPVLCDPIEVTRNLLAYKFARVGYPLHSGDPKILWSASRRLGVLVGDDRAVRRRIDRDRLLNESVEEFAATE